MNLEEEIAHLLKEGRLKESRSLDEVAVTVGISRDQLLDYEHGHVSIPAADLYKLVDTYRVREGLDHILIEFARSKLEE